MNKPDTSFRPAPAGATQINPNALRGRGARSNNAGRFEKLATKISDDGWGSLDSLSKRPRTQTIRDTSRSIINPVTSPDIGFDRSINPYRGCEHGCIYCFARPTHAYLGLSPGQDFETHILVKPDAPALLRQELQRPGYRVRHIAIGTNTDPYQPIEREQKTMRQLLEVLLEFRHPVGIVTKSALILRDIDLLQELARRELVHVSLSVTTLTPKLARAMEPRAATPMRRLHAIEELSKAGVPTGVMVAPVIPGLTDHEMEAIMREAANRGATGAGYILLRLPNEVAPLFREWLGEVAPDKLARVMRHVREARSGNDNDSAHFQRMRGKGPYAELLASRFRIALKRHRLKVNRPGLRTDLFAVPDSLRPQLDLFADLPHQGVCTSQN
ncbi:MAG: PA0069 family radical SAM protein [Alphaproteobacteria bacterium]